MEKKHWRGITVYGTKKSLRFAAEQLDLYGVCGVDWCWLHRGELWAVAIPKKEWDRLEEKRHRDSEGLDIKKKRGKK